ncbi:MAG: hypothetical protein V4850_23290 [Myxococcota bacterium]
MLTLLGEDVNSETVDLEDQQTWADTYGLTTPVLADDGYPTMWAMGGTGGLPFMALVARGGEILAAGNAVADAEVEAALED